MDSYAPSYQASDQPTSSVKAVVIRMPLVMMTVLFTLIAGRYMLHPVQAAAAVGISFTSPNGITVARVGFAAFPLSLALLALLCLISRKRLLLGLHMAIIILAVVMLVRAVGVALDHSGLEGARLLVPEVFMTVITLLAIRFERQRIRALNAQEA